MIQVGVGACHSREEYGYLPRTALLAMGATTAVGKLYIGSKLNPSPPIHQSPNDKMFSAMPRPVGAPAEARQVTGQLRA